MTNRERAMAVLNYKSYDRLPIVHFGFWGETLVKWYQEGHITQEEAYGDGDGNAFDVSIGRKLGFDFNWYSCAGGYNFLFPAFERKVLEKYADGSQKAVDDYGVVIIEKPGTVSIPKEIDHLLKDRASYEEHFKHRLQYSPDRVNVEYFKTLADDTNRDIPLGLHCGSLFGNIRNILGVEGTAYLYADDEDLYAEIIEDVGTLSYQVAKAILETGAKFDFGHFWEDICFKNGPLVVPHVFDEYVGPQYKRITDLLNEYGINIISLDCDGMIDALIPTWFANGVNTMFPIEVGTWDANIKPWREKYGKELRGVGGMNKTVFAHDKKAIDAEIERLKPLIDLGGYIPCPDHRIAPDAKWENVCYYTEKMKSLF